MKLVFRALCDLEYMFHALNRGTRRHKNGILCFHNDELADIQIHNEPVRSMQVVVTDILLNDISGVDIAIFVLHTRLIKGLP